MPEERSDAQELAMLVKRLDRQRRAREAAEAISESATQSLYDKQQHLKLLQAVAVGVNESSSLDDALQTAVDQICKHLGWPVGHAYLCVGELLALGNIWYIADLARFETFRRAIETTVVASGTGIASRSLAGKVPLFSTEVPQAARDVGIKAVMAIPVLRDDGAPVAALELFAFDDAPPDEMLVDVMTKIGEVLGKVHLRTRAEATLRSSEEQYRLLFQGNPNPMWIYDADSLQFLALNDAAVAQYAWSREELLGMTLRDLQAPDPFGVTAPPREGLMRLVKKDGSIVTVDLNAYDIRLPGRNARLAMAIDADDGKRAEEALRESERRFREMLDTIQLVAVLLDPVATITYCNPYLLRITGYAKHEVIGRNFFDLFLPEERRAKVSRGFLANIGRGIVAAHDELEIVTRRGERRIILWNNTVLRNPQGSVLGTASIGTDVTEQRHAEQQLLHNAFHDSLTGLPNRALFLDRVAHALSRVRRDGKRCFAVLLLDVDHFKNVNDSLGHAAGDDLLIAIGRRIERCLRAADTVSRFGGDEFTVLVENIVTPADATRAAVRIQTEISEPFKVQGHDIYTSASIGIIIAGTEYEGPEQILRDADTAMYRAKAQGRARSEIFDANMRAEAVARLQLETDLRRGLERDELRVFYQPIVTLDGGRTVGFEALVRWEHPQQGIIAPAQFIPLAEETGLVVAVGETVLSKACRQVARWRNGHRDLHVSVNVSSRQFAHGDLIADVRGALDESGLDPSALHLEITESVIIQQPETAQEVIEQLREIGCRIALDDFGTGYSSLSYLHRFPIDRLKIDGSFVRAPGERKNVEIIRAIIELGRTLGMDVVAEGIETPAQHELLRGLGCGLGQGFLFSRPVDADHAEAFLSPRA